jgi:hypothetical protein
MSAGAGMDEEVSTSTRPSLRDINKLVTEDDLEAAAQEIKWMIYYVGRDRVYAAVKLRETVLPERYSQGFNQLTEYDLPLLRRGPFNLLVADDPYRDKLVARMRAHKTTSELTEGEQKMYILLVARRIYDPSSNITYEQVHDESADRGFYYCLFYLEYLVDVRILEKLRPHLQNANMQYMSFFRETDRDELKNKYTERLRAVWLHLDRMLSGEHHLIPIAVDLHFAIKAILAYPSDEFVQNYDRFLTVELLKDFWPYLLRIEVAIHELRLAYGFVTENTKITPDLLHIAHLYMIPWRNLLAAYRINMNVWQRPSDVKSSVDVIDFFVWRFVGMVHMFDRHEDQGIRSLYKRSLVKVLTKKLDTSQLEGHDDLKGSIFDVENYIRTEGIKRVEGNMKPNRCERCGKVKR